jgi:2-C-methyl-D-erythritol 2,4-cyclodiphosphate synthase
MTDDMRVGIGVDAHAFAEGRRLVLGGVQIDHDRGLVGHSDADVVCHAACDAILGAAGMEDIGHLFPPGDPAYKDASSLALLESAWERVRAAGWELVNLDAVVILEEPQLAPHRVEMRAAVAGALGAEAERVTVRATTTDHLGFTGRGEGAACHAVALLRRPG